MERSASSNTNLLEPQTSTDTVWPTAWQPVTWGKGGGVSGTPPLPRVTAHLDNPAGSHGNLLHKVSTPKVIRHKVVQACNGSAAESLQRNQTIPHTYHSSGPTPTYHSSGPTPHLPLRPHPHHIPYR